MKGLNLLLNIIAYFRFWIKSEIQGEWDRTDCKLARETNIPRCRDTFILIDKDWSALDLGEGQTFKRRERWR